MKLSKHPENLMNRLVLSMLFLVWSTGTYANSETELLKSLESAKDTQRVNILVALAKSAHQHSDIKSQLTFAQKARHIADSISFPKGSLNAVSQIAVAYRDLGSYEKAITLFHHVANGFRNLNEERSEYKTYTYLANTYEKKGEYDKAVEYSLKSLAGSEKIQDSLTAASAYTILGVLQFRRGDADKAMQYYNKAIRIFKNAGKHLSVANIYNNIGALWAEKNDFNKALLSFQAAEQINSEQQNKAELWSNYTNQGLMYEKLQQLERARELHSKSIQLCRDIQNNQGIATGYLNLASVEAQTNPVKAKVFLDSAIAVARLVNNKALFYSIYFAFSEVARMTDDHRNAYAYYRQYTAYKDSILNEEKQEKIEQLQAIYETEKKDKQIELLNKSKEIKDHELKQQKLVNYGVAGGLALMLSFSAVLGFAYREKKKANNKLVTANTLIEEKSRIVEEKNKDITDSISYAKKIQEAILPSEELFHSFADHFILYGPRDIVSGDFYFAAKVNGETILAAADCTGHGVPGAFMSLIGNELLHKAIEKKINDPSEILAEINNGIRKALKQGEGSTAPKDGMDISVCVFDQDLKQVRIASAHRPVYHVRNGELTEIKPDKLSIGQFDGEKAAFTNSYVNLEKGDWIYLSSDGFADQFGGPKGKKFLSKNLRSLISAGYTEDGSTQKNLLAKAFVNWKGNAEQVDDVMLIGIGI